MVRALREPRTRSRDEPSSIAAWTPDRPRARGGLRGRRHRPRGRVARGGDRRRGARRPGRAATDCLAHARRAGRVRGGTSWPPKPSSRTWRARRPPSSCARRRSGCASSAATRWPAARRAATRRRSADLFVDRPWVVVPTADAAAVERVEDLAGACRRAAGPAWRRGPRPGRRRDQPPAARRRGGARRGRRRGEHGRPVARLADRRRPRRLGLARHDAAGPRRRRDGRRDRRHERRRRSPRACASSSACSTAGWRTSSGPGGPDAGASRTRLRPRANDSRRRRDERRAGPRRRRAPMPGRRRLVRPADRRSRRVPRRSSRATGATRRGRDGARSDATSRSSRTSSCATASATS